MVLADHVPPSNIEFKSEWNPTSVHSHVFKACTETTLNLYFRLYSVGYIA